MLVNKFNFPVKNHQLPDEEDERDRQKYAVGSLLLLTNGRVLKTSGEKEFVYSGVDNTNQNKRKNILNEAGENCEPEQQITIRRLIIFLSYQILSCFVSLVDPSLQSWVILLQCENIHSIHLRCVWCLVSYLNTKHDGLHLFRELCILLSHLSTDFLKKENLSKCSWESAGSHHDPGHAVEVGPEEDEGGEEAGEEEDGR